MDGIKIGGIILFLGKIPYRKQECFYFAEGTNLYPVAYISEKNLPEAKRLWGTMISAILPSLISAIPDTASSKAGLYKG